MSVKVAMNTYLHSHSLVINHVLLQFQISNVLSLLFFIPTALFTYSLYPYTSTFLHFQEIKNEKKKRIWKKKQIEEIGDLGYL